MSVAGIEGLFMDLPEDAVLSYSVHGDRILCLAWSPDGAYIASGGHGKTVRILDIVRSETKVVIQAEDVVCALAWAPDGSALLVGGWGRNIGLWDTSMGVLRTSYETVLGTVYGLAYAPDGAQFAAAGELASGQRTAFPEIAPIPLVEMTTGLTKLIYQRHSGVWVTDVAWAPTPNRMLIASAGYDDSTVQVWQADTGEQVFAASIAHDDEVLRVTWAPDCKHIAAATVRGLFVYEVPSGRLIANTPEQEESRFNAVAWAPHRNLLAAIDGYDGVPGIYDPVTCVPLYQYHGHEPGTRALAIAWSPDGTRIASVAGSAIHVWVPPDL